MPEEPEIDDERIAAVCQVLLDHHVDFVVIGGVAARLHDTGHATVDIDICPSSADDNLERLGDALRSIDARLRVEGEPYPALEHDHVVIVVSGVDVPVASLDAVVRSKRAAGRPKDVVALPALEARLREHGRST